MATIVVALGGNAILRAGQRGTHEEQLANVDMTAEKLAQLVKRGHRLVVTHGNGPQVGNLLIQNEAGRDLVPALPLDACGAQTQGQLGYMIQQRLESALLKEGISLPVVALVTRSRVAADDPAFANPTKPIGPFFSREPAQQRMAGGEHWIEDSGRGWRRVVPSPLPLEILEIEAIKTLVAGKAIVVAAGGGGVPVQRRGDKLEGVEAVIDKDYASCRLACALGADMLLILTDVDKVAINFGTPEQKNLDRITVNEAASYLAQGYFGTGSMAPKVKAAIDFMKSGGKKAVIASLVNAVNAVEGKAGTIFLP